MSDDCANYGFLNGTACACPVGFGGSDCTQPSCGGTIFQGLSRATAPRPPGGGYANLTASSCSCEGGWTGTGCNVCQSANACQTGFNAIGGSGSVPSGYLPADGANGQNETMVCNTGSTVYASSSMSCDVNVSPYLPNSHRLCLTMNHRIRHCKPYTHSIRPSTSLGPSMARTHLCRIPPVSV